MKRLENKKEKRTIGLELIKILILEKVAEQTGCAQVAGRQEPGDLLSPSPPLQKSSCTKDKTLTGERSGQP